MKQGLERRHANRAATGQLSNSWIYKNTGKSFFMFYCFFDFSLYGSWEALDSLKTLPRGTPTFSTPGEAIPRLFEKSIFLVPRRPQWARAHGPMGKGPWANGPGSMGPMGQGPWARAHGPNGPGPMGPSFPAIGITIFTREKLACRDSGVVHVLHEQVGASR